MLISAIQCPKCDDIIYSRARHDFRKCSCKTISVDGGFDYMHISWEPSIPWQNIKWIDIEVDATAWELHDDYETRTDKYGLIKGGK